MLNKLKLWIYNVVIERLVTDLVTDGPFISMLYLALKSEERRLDEIKKKAEQEKRDATQIKMLNTG